MTTTSTPQGDSAARHGLVPQMLNHYARITNDVATIAEFYTRVLGLELASTVLEDHVPSTGEELPFFHVFFRLADGSTFAFFECSELPDRAQPAHPVYGIFDHFAFQAADLGELDRWKVWLQSQDVDVIGPIDHGIGHSIYFRDPDGFRLELTVMVDPEWNRRTEQGYADLKAWVETKQRARLAGENPTPALRAMVRGRKQARQPVADPVA